MKRLRFSRVVLEKHHKPVAVLVDPKEYDRMANLLEEFSDLVLAHEARKREMETPGSAYVDLETVEKRLRH